jgi:adenylate cyclase, class 2
MASEDKEIEIKLPLLNKEEVENFLEKHGKAVSKSIFQKDTYYLPAHRNFLGFKYPFEWLRLRETSKGSSINYKHFHPENSKVNDYCDEFETKVDDPEAIKKIFQSLDFKEAVIVEKTRNTWLYKEAEIAIDNVKKLGTFIEIEATHPFEDPKEGKRCLFRILNELHAQVGEENLRGYPFSILEKEGHRFGDA